MFTADDLFKALTTSSNPKEQVKALNSLRDELDKCLASKPETGEQWAHICLLESQINSHA